MCVVSIELLILYIVYCLCDNIAYVITISVLPTHYGCLNLLNICETKTSTLNPSYFQVTNILKHPYLQEWNRAFPRRSNGITSKTISSMRIQAYMQVSDISSRSSICCMHTDTRIYIRSSTDVGFYTRVRVNANPVRPTCASL